MYVRIKSLCNFPSFISSPPSFLSSHEKKEHRIFAMGDMYMYDWNSVHTYIDSYSTTKISKDMYLPMCMPM